ncbi:RecX family transcriptional regulator [Myxococcota bacterium]|nr:RecX family transcriptional regulator [Myxococcota bacterium]
MLTRQRRPPRGADPETHVVPPLTAAMLERTALWHLGRRAMTTGELRAALQKKAARHPPHAEAGVWIDALVARFTDGAVLDDARVARDRISTGRGRGWSRRRIEQKLRGVAAEVRAEAFETVDAEATIGPPAECVESAELQAARIFVARKRLHEKPPEKALAALARQGFSYGIARVALTPR